MTAITNFMRQQGFPEEPADACDMRFQGLYFQPAIVFPLVLVAVALQSAPLFLCLRRSNSSHNNRLHRPKLRLSARPLQYNSRNRTPKLSARSASSRRTWRRPAKNTGSSITAPTSLAADS